MEYIIDPFVSVGNIKFDMTRDDIIDIFGKKPDQELRHWDKRNNIFYSNIHIKINQNGVANEIVFYKGENELILEGKNLFKDKKIIKLLSINEEPIRTSDKILFKNLGILFYNFEDKKEKRISVLSRKKRGRYSRIMNRELFGGKPFLLLEYYYDNINSDSDLNKYYNNILFSVTDICYNGNDEDIEKLRAMIEKMDIKFKELKK